MIQIPAYSPVAPQPVPEGQGPGVSGEYWPTLQQIYQTPQNRNRANASMFSGGLEGLQDVAQALGGVSGEMQKLLDERKQVEDYIKFSELDRALEGVNTKVSVFQEENWDRPELWEAYREEQYETVRKQFLEEGAGGDPMVFEKMRHKFGMSAARAKTATVIGAMESTRSRGYKEVVSNLENAAMKGRVEDIPGLVAEAVEQNAIDEELAYQFVREYEEKALMTRGYGQIDSDPIQALKDIEGGRYDTLGPRMKMRLEGAARTQINVDQRQLSEDISANPDNYSNAKIDDLVKREKLDKETGERFKVSWGRGDLTPKELGDLKAKFLAYNPKQDKNSAGRVWMAKELAIVKLRNDTVSYEILKDVYDDAVKETGISSDPRFTSAKDWINNEVDAFISSKGPRRKTEEEEAALETHGGTWKGTLTERVKEYIEEKDPGYQEIRKWVKEAVQGEDLDLLPGAGSQYSPSSRGVPRIDARTRDQIGKASVPGARQISLDFNDTKGGKFARYATIVIPDDATPQEEKLANQYLSEVTQFFNRHGVRVPNKGAVKRSENKRGTKGRFHTEPFFLSDPESRAVIEKNPDEYAQILLNTLGQIPGVTFIAPHTSKAPGAARGDFNERDFAKNVLLPSLLKQSKPSKAKRPKPATDFGKAMESWLKENQ